jgi:hypothetical protein
MSASPSAPRVARAVALKAPPHKSPKHTSCFDRQAAEFPYMFVGALPEADTTDMVTVALSNAVENLAHVTPEEALLGWALPSDPYFAIGERPSAGDVSKAAYKFHKTAKAFQTAVEPETWTLWEEMGKKADEAGMKALIKGARAAATNRDTRRLVLQNALYFAGLATDEPGTNVNAWALRDNKARHEAYVEFVRNGPTDLAAMNAAANRAAATIAADHAAAAAGVKRKRAAEAEDPEAAKKVRRAALMAAFMDAGVDVPVHNDMTDEERTFLDCGPKKVSDVMDEAEAIAARRLIAA